MFVSHNIPYVSQAVNQAYFGTEDSRQSQEDNEDSSRSLCSSNVTLPKFNEIPFEKMIGQKTEFVDKLLIELHNQSNDCLVSQ